MKKLLLYLILVFGTFSDGYAYNITVVQGPTTSNSSRAPQGNQRWIRNCYIISAAELAAANFPVNVAVTGIGWTFSVAQSITTTGNLQVYLENTTDAAYSKPSTAWTNGTNGVIDNMTLVSDAATTIPNAIGDYDVTFANGNSFTYTGGALYIAFEYSNVANPISSFPTALATSVAVGVGNPFRGVATTSTTAPATLTGTSAFRPQTRLGYPVNNDVTMHDVYALGQLPMGYGTPHTISAHIINTCDNALTNVPVTLNITGANTFNDVQNVSIPVGGSTVVSFSAFTPTATGNNTINVSVPADDVATNNSKNFGQEVNTGSAFSYANSDAATTSIGFNTSTGILACKYSIMGGTNVLGVTIFLSPTATNTGNTLTGVMLDGAGTIVGQSAPYVVTAGDLGTYLTFNFLAAPLATNQDFYVGVLQGANAVGYFPVGVQPEPLPARSGAYYSFLPTGGAATQYTNLGRFMIAANLSQFPLAAKDLVLHATLVKQDVKLDWKSISHDKVLKYDVERSSDGVGFVSAGTVAAVDNADEQTYYFTDNNAANCSHPALYYRIRQTDIGGSISYSPVAKVQLGKQNSFTLAVVNPARGAVQLSVNMPEAGEAGIAISDAQGRVVYRTTMQLNAGTHSFQLGNAPQLAPGNYFIAVMNGNNKLTQAFTQL